MLARLLLGTAAALRAVLIPGEAGVVLTSGPLQWPTWLRRRPPVVADIEQPRWLRAA